MKILLINSCFLIFGSLISHVEVASFLTSSGKSNGLSSSRKLSKHHRDACIKMLSSDLSESESVKKDAILSESVMNKRLIEMGSEPIDFELLKKTIAEWSRPLPLEYFSQPLILVGPSGVGKGRLVKALLKDYKRFFAKIVTHTTRGPRPDEVDGISYHFVSNDTFHGMVRDGKFLEWAGVHDNSYGTSIEAFRAGQKSGKISIMEIDVQGARSVKAISEQYKMKPKYVFIAPPAIEKLQQRLELRGTETPEQVKLRIQNAERELAESQEAGLFDEVIVNDDFQATVNAFFRLMRDWYPALPSAARIRMLQRRLKSIKQLASAPTEGAGGAEGAGGGGGGGGGGIVRDDVGDTPSPAAALDATI